MDRERKMMKKETKKFIKDSFKVRKLGIDYSIGEFENKKLTAEEFKEKINEYVNILISANKQKFDNFKNLFIGIGIFVFGVIGLFFEQSRSVAPFFLGFGAVYLTGLIIKK